MGVINNNNNMKFKITRSQFDLISRLFDGKGSDFLGEIVLEPADMTATQAMYEESLKKKAWHDGYHYGLREGYYNGRYPEKMYKCEFCPCAHR